jgi:predicted nuclease of predicted toxin-antitoxin system
MKFLADMGISPKTVAFLQSLGHDAEHLHHQGLDRLPDSSILEKARREARVLLTHDLDFGELIAASGTLSPSVIIFRLRNMRPERVNRYLQEIIPSTKWRSKKALSSACPKDRFACARFLSKLAYRNIEQNETWSKMSSCSTSFIPIQTSITMRARPPAPGSAPA